MKFSETIQISDYNSEWQYVVIRGEWNSIKHVKTQMTRYGRTCFPKFLKSWQVGPVVLVLYFHQFLNQCSQCTICYIFICFCHVILMWPLFWWPLHTLVGLFGSLHKQTHMALLCCNVVSIQVYLDHFTIHFYILFLSFHCTLLIYHYTWTTFMSFDHMINGFCHMFSPKYQFSQCSQCSQINKKIDYFSA